MIKEDTKIMFDDDIVEYKTNIEGWVGIKSRRFFGKDGEALARFNECTHKTCECGNTMGRSYTKCQSCRVVGGNKRYKEREYRDIEFPVYSDLADQYFGTADDLEIYVYDTNYE